jgi:hypothetical protein
MPTPSVEERLTALEKEMAQIKQQLVIEKPQTITRVRFHCRPR